MSKKTPLSSKQQSALNKIIDAGGTVRHSFMSGWLGGVKGLRIDTVNDLVRLGYLARTSEEVTKRTRRSGALGYHITMYTLR